MWGTYSSDSIPLSSHGLVAVDPMTATGAGMGTRTRAGNDRVQIAGSICIHGREMSEWSLKALRERITFMTEDDLDYSLPAGLLLLRFVCIVVCCPSISGHGCSCGLTFAIAALDKMPFHVLSCYTILCYVISS